MRQIRILTRLPRTRKTSLRMLPRDRMALAGLALAVLCSCGPESGQTANPTPLADCEPGDGPSNALCGWIPVYEDRSAASGRQIDLRVVVYPATSRNRKPDPIFAAGRGSGAGCRSAQLASCQLVWRCPRGARHSFRRPAWDGPPPTDCHATETPMTWARSSATITPSTRF